MKSTDTKAFYYLINRFIRPYWRYSLLLVFLSVLTALLTSVQPLVIAPFLDTTLMGEVEPAHSLFDVNLNNIGRTLIYHMGLSDSGDRWSLIWVTVGLYILIASTAALLQFGAHMFSAWIGSSAFRDLQVALYKHLMSLSMSYFVRNKSGDIVSRFTNDAGETMTSMDLAVRQMLQSGIEVLVYGFFLFKTDLGLAVSTLSVSALHLVITRLLRDRIRSQTADRYDALASLSNIVQESLIGIRNIKSFAAERFEIDQFTQSSQQVLKLTMRQGYIKNVEKPLRWIADAVAVGVILLLAFRSYQTGSMNIQGFVLFVYLAKQTIAPASLFSQSTIRLYSGLGSANRVLEMLQTRLEIRDGTKTVDGFHQGLRLENVSFSYLPDIPVLKDINLEIRKGELVAVVGSSGAGKSTLADIVLRLYDPTSGCVRLDGIDIRDFKQEQYRRLFGVVSQECLLFNASLRDNIAYGRPTHSDEDLVRAARIANAEEFIASLPDRYETRVGDRGIRLSGGQRQRIAIARAIFGQPRILILDEATSSLDTGSERLVQEAIDRVLENMTAIVIAHRLSTVIHADKIVVMNRGVIESVGSHRELLQISPLYRHLYELQFKDTGSNRNELLSTVEE